MDWLDVKDAYNDQFPSRKRKGFQGIQWLASCADALFSVGPRTKKHVVNIIGISKKEDSHKSGKGPDHLLRPTTTPCELQLALRIHG